CARFWGDYVDDAFDLW
nr:immunoglobulin heavy chain junction region [Macaca mulatta]